MIKQIKNDILKIYNNVMNEGKVGKIGYPNHDTLQQRLSSFLSLKYGLVCKTEYVGKGYFDKEKGKYKKGRIDLVFYKDGEDYMSLEIDCGLKGTSIKKLLANDSFKYRVWFCYNKNVNTSEYFNLINKIDTNNEIIYLTK